MRHDYRTHWHGLRGLGIAAISALGIVAIVASGGGSIGGFPDYTGPQPGPPGPTAFVEPPYVTALVGTPATFTAEVFGASGTITYQWARSFDGGKTFVDIPGATGNSYSLNGVTLGDDAAVFRVRVKVSSSLYSPTALGHLAVSANAPLVFVDGEFPLDDWVASTKADEGAPTLAHSEERIPSGGNPGAFRQMFVQVISQAGGVFHASQSAAYDPASAGQIYVIDYEEDCMIIQRGTTMVSTTSRLMIEQAGRRYLPSALRLGERSGFDSCASISWSQMKRSSLGSQDFTFVDGPACDAGESCPDFSATGPPIRFGYARSSSGGPGASITHGIDNWKVTVWRR